MGEENIEIEGDWNGFHIRYVRPEDEDILQEHLKANFYRDEPLCNLMGYCDQLAEDFKGFWVTFVTHNLSLIAFDKATNKVAGTRITIDHRKGFDWSAFKCESWQCQTLVTMLGEAEIRSDIGSKYDVDRYADWFLVSVEKEFRGRGLAQEMYKRSVAVAKVNGFPLIKCVFSSPYSRKASTNLGFKELCSFKFTDVLNENGEPYLPNAAPEQILSLGVFEL